MFDSLLCSGTRMSESRVSGGLECSPGHSSADEQVISSSPLGGRATPTHMAGVPNSKIKTYPLNMTNITGIQYSPKEVV